MKPKVVIIMGSNANFEWANQIEKELNESEILVAKRIASAHKVPMRSYQLIKDYEKDNVVFITKVGMNNKLSRSTDEQTHCPVIACSPYSEKFSASDIFSSIRMPSGVAQMTVISPGNALAAAKIIAFSDNNVQNKIGIIRRKDEQKLNKLMNQ